MRVVTTTLELRHSPTAPPVALPDDVRLDLVTDATPEFVRFLYGLVGGPWTWTDRLGWSREQWADELALTGSEVRVLYAGGAPAGYVQLRAEVLEEQTEVEILYFGLVETSIGKGRGRSLLEHGVAAAWSLAERHDLPPVTRVWVHTCTLDGPTALANYQARGFTVCEVRESVDLGDGVPLGSWVSTGGPPQGSVGVADQSQE